MKKKKEPQMEDTVSTLCTELDIFHKSMNSEALRFSCHLDRFEEFDELSSQISEEDLLTSLFDKKTLQTEPTTSSLAQPDQNPASNLRRNMSAYNMFIRDQVISADQLIHGGHLRFVGKSTQEMMATLSSEWHTLDAAHKNKFAHLAEQGRPG